MAAITQTDVLLRMSYLLGEQTIPTTGIEDRKQFINDALARVYRSYNFNEAQAIATVTVTAGAGTLPSDIGESPSLDVRVINAGSNNDYIYQQIPYEDQDNYVDGDYKYWLTGSAGSYTLNTKDTQTPLIVRYMQESPSINASIATTFPSAMAVARGALVYYRLAENPDADTSQDEAFFQKELQEVISRQNRNRPVRRAKSIMELNNHYTGDI
jgi:hypothetical protein